MRQVLVIPATLILLVTSRLTGAQQTPGGPDSLIEEVFELSGMQQQVDQIPGHIRALPMAPHAPPGLQAAVRQVLTETFAPASLSPLIKESLRSDFDPDRMAVLLTWLHS